MFGSNFVIWCHACHRFVADSLGSVGKARSAARQHRKAQNHSARGDVQILKEIKE